MEGQQKEDTILVFSETYTREDKKLDNTSKILLGITCLLVIGMFVTILVVYLL
jgi:hypothetical protein